MLAGSQGGLAGVVSEAGGEPGEEGAAGAAVLLGGVKSRG